MSNTIQAREPETYIKTDNVLGYTSRRGERIELRLCEDQGALLRVNGGEYEFLRGEDIYDALSQEFTRGKLREDARNRVDAETFRQTIDDLILSIVF